MKLPWEVCAKHGVVQQDLVRGQVTTQVQDAVHEVASEAVLHLNSARAMIDDSPEAARACFLPAVCLKAYLDRLLQVDFNPLHPALQQPQGLLPIKLWLAKFKKSYP